MNIGCMYMQTMWLVFHLSENGNGPSKNENGRIVSISGLHVVDIVYLVF